MMKKIVRESIFIKPSHNEINEGFFGDMWNKVKGMFSGLFKSKETGFYLDGTNANIESEDLSDIIPNAMAPINIAIMKKKRMLPKAVYYVPTTKEKNIESSIQELTLEKAYNELDQNDDEAVYESYGKKGRFVNEDLANAPRIGLEARKDSNMLNVNTQQLMKNIDKRILNSKLAPLIIWGAPGIGKTAIVKTVLSNYEGERRLIDVQTTQMVPDDWSLPAIAEDEIAKAYIESSIIAEAAKLGIDYEQFKKDPDNRLGKGDSAKYAELRQKIQHINNPHEYLKAVDLPKTWLPAYLPTGDREEDERRNKVANGPDNLGGIIFLDEVSRAPSDVQATCLKLVQDRQVGGAIIGSAWLIVAAANRQQDEPNDKSINWSTALGNRFNNLNFVPEYKEWRSWAKENGVAELILDFLDFKYKEYFYTLRKTGDKNTVFASPRSWTNASEEVKAEFDYAKEKGYKPSPDDIADAIAGHVGADIAEEFRIFLKVLRNFSKRDLKQILEDAVDAKLPKGNRINYSPQDEKFVRENINAFMSAETPEERPDTQTMAKVVNIIRGGNDKEVKKFNPADSQPIFVLLRNKWKNSEIPREEWENYMIYLTRLNDKTSATLGLVPIIAEHPELHLRTGEDVNDTMLKNNKKWIEENKDKITDDLKNADDFLREIGYPGEDLTPETLEKYL